MIRELPDSRSLALGLLGRRKLLSDLRLELEVLGGALEVREGARGRGRLSVLAHLWALQKHLPSLLSPGPVGPRARPLWLGTQITGNKEAI